ncbi:MAG: glycosyltransferase family 1 protein [Candidatus Methanoperedens sp.]|nr:glycosyltransferase family 1 protein [Candidatus Methanoperedens sp.]
MTEGLVVGIDASRNRSGGAKAHLAGILSEGDPLKHGVEEVHVWTYASLLDSIPERPWLVKHNPRELEQSLAKQLCWQATKLSSEVAAAGCDILFTTDASTFCRFKPMVVMSQDMLPYEPGMMKYFGFTRDRLRLLTILYLQNRAMRAADGVIFLSRYASKVIQQSCGPLSHIAFIPHGIGADFKHSEAAQDWPVSNEHPVRCIYVSDTMMYKHQWMVVKAIARLRRQGYNVALQLIGDGSGRAQRLLDQEIARCDPNRTFVTQTGFVPHKELPANLVNSDLFVFASGCENMPVSLLEAMAVGLPIACSNRGPMPEVLQDGGVYFDPENPDSIAAAMERLICDRALRERVAQRAKQLSEQYSWSRCSEETWRFITETLRSV